jgi:hypothetical protein
VRAYLVDRVVTKAWTLEEVTAELGAAPSTLRRLLDHHQTRRVARTRRQHAAAAAASGPRKQMGTVQQRRQARLAEFGFADLDAYLQGPVCGAGLVGAAAVR